MLMFGLSSVTTAIGTALASGAIGTAFCAQYNITPAITATILIPYRIILLAVMLTSTAFIDRIRNRIAFNALTILLGAVPCAGMLVKCLGPESFRTVGAIMAIDIVFSIPNAILGALRGGADATVQCRVLHNEIRGRFWSIIGMISGIAGLLVGVLITFLLKRFDICTASVLATIPGMAFMVISGICAWRTVELPDLSNAEPPKKEPVLKSISNIVTMKQFRIMMPANFMRGMGDGCVGFALLLALQNWALPQEYAGYHTIVCGVAPFLGYVILGLTLDRFGAALVLPLTDGFMGLAMIGMVAIPNGYAFLAFTMIYQMLLITESAAIPLAHFEVVPNEVMGAFSNVRLLLLQLTGAISGTLAGLCLGVFSPLLVFGVGAAIKISAGLLYSYGIVKLGKHGSKTAA